MQARPYAIASRKTIPNGSYPGGLANAVAPGEGSPGRPPPPPGPPGAPAEEVDPSPAGGPPLWADNPELGLGPLRPHEPEGLEQLRPPLALPLLADEQKARHV